jgi:hypothetical protein
MHLQIREFASLFGLDELLLAYYYFPAFYLFMLLLLPYLIMRGLGASRFLGFVTALLMLASDLSWLWALLGDAMENTAWTGYFLHPAWGSLTLNSMLPALIAFFAFLLLLVRLPERPVRAWGASLLLVLLAAYQFKVTLGLHLAAIGLLFSFWQWRLEGGTARTRVLATACGAGLLFMFLLVSLAVTTGSLQVVEVQPFSLLGTRAAMAGFDTSSLPMLLSSLTVMLVIVVGVPVFAAIAALRDPAPGKAGRQLVVFLALFAGTGLVLAEFVFVGYRGGANNSQWFAIASIFAGWLLLGLGLASLRDWAPIARGALALVILAVLWPSTLQLLALRQQGDYFPVDSDSMEIVEALKSAPPDSVVLHPLNLYGPSLASNLAGRNTFLSFHMTFIDQFAELEPRARAVDAFMGSEMTPGIRRDSLDAAGITHVYLPTSNSEIVTRLPRSRVILSNPTWTLVSVGEAH